MKRHCLTGKQRAFRWTILALAVLLLALGLYWLDTRPCLTADQAIREAERREATRQTVLLKTHTVQDTDYLLTGNEDVLLVVRFRQQVLKRLLSAPGYLIAFDRGLPPFDPAQEGAPLRCGHLILEPADGTASPRFLLVLGTTDHPQGTSVVLTAETADAWTAAVPLEESPFGYRYFWFWKELPPPTGGRNFRRPPGGDRLGGRLHRHPAGRPGNPAGQPDRPGLFPLRQRFPLRRKTNY